RDCTPSARSALAALADRGTAAGDGPPLGRAALARLLYFSAGVLRRKTYAGGEIYFRAAACTGALYHIDLYLISGPLPDLEAGVYHFGPHDFALRRLRAGDHRAAVVAATASEAAMAAAPAGAARTAARPHDAAALPARGRLPRDPARARRLVAHHGEEGRRLARAARAAGVHTTRRPHRPARTERRDGRARRNGDPPAGLDPHLRARADRARPALDHPARIDRRHPGRLGGPARPLPHRARGRRPRPGHLRPRPRGRAAGPAPGRRLPPRSWPPGTRAGAARRGGRLRLLARRLKARVRALREPRLPRRAARGGYRGRQELPGRLRAPPGRYRPHLLRR